MKKIMPLTDRRFVTAAVVALLGGWFATPSPAAEKESPVGEQMSAMNKAFRTIKRQVDDASKNADSAVLAGKMKETAEKSKTLVPDVIKDLPAAEKEKQTAAYNKYLDELIAVYGNLEAAFKGGKADEAKALIEKISEMKKTAHEHLKVDD